MPNRRGEIADAARRVVIDGGWLDSLYARTAVTGRDVRGTTEPGIYYLAASQSRFQASR